ncbi:DNA-dependent protein kinase catalytic subunit-like isoform X2 [Cylas formicarius]|uniref:DNA-dependent protein kinase catalytic subunit-like isoform X2 n=1 Tax=Cylas formicarius TaxID=197179 RepID=UPI002958B1E6|nr:DNA-dependent protein kinase catalytic subunit-like isoform X2 [Cylas formicarius]
MDVELPYFCRLLKDRSSDEIDGPQECQRLLNTLNHNLTEEQLSSTTIDSCVVYLFDKSYGLLDFVADVGARKEFNSSSTKCLEIVHTLVNNFPQKVSQRVVDVNEKCLKIIQTNVAANVKVRAYDVLLVSFDKIDVCAEHQKSYLNIFESVKNAVMLDHPATVRQKEHVTIGVFVKRFPYLVAEPDLIKNYLVRQLDNEMVRRDSPGNICAIFTALACFCEGFPLDAGLSTDKTIIEKLYAHIRCLSVPKGSIKVGNRAALNFLKSNMATFIGLMLPKHIVWHKRLLDWLELGAEDVKTGEATLRAYLFAVAEHSSNADVLLHFVKWMRHVLKKEQAGAAEKRLVLSALKVFSGPLHQHLPPEEARNTFLLIRRHFEAAYVLRCDADADDWEHLPDYLQCVAGFIRFQNASATDIHCLQRAIVNLFKTYPKLKPFHRSLAIEALATTLFYLRKTDHFESFLESAIYQGVIWSCSHRHATNAVGVTVKDYFPLWRGVLKLTGDRSLDRYSIFLDDRKYLVVRIIDRLIKTLMMLVNKLDVTLDACQDVDVTDIGTLYKARNPDDYAVFLNVVDFYLEIFDAIEPTTLTRCVAKMVDHFVDRCRRHPLVSGFYKLLAAAMKIADALSVVALEPSQKLSGFVVATARKVKRFKDELLVACLQVLLATPASVAEPLLEHYAPAFEVIFKGHTALADSAVDCLERWQRYVDRDVFDDFLVRIVHYLDGYLTGKSLASVAQTAGVGPSRKTSRALKKRSVLVELEPELVKFQQRALAFVGSQTERVCRALVRPDRVQRMSRCGSARYLKVALPYDDVAVVVHLEALVERVAALALHSTDRKTKITACEVLQAITVTLLGYTKQLTPTGLSDTQDLVEDVASALLCLAGDVDPVVRQLFEPLFLQLAHWYSAPQQSSNPHVAVILNVLTEGAAHPTNSSVRDFAGVAIGEFVKWTIKQTGEKSLANDPKHVRVIVRKMRFFASHPDYAKKRGSTVIFNNIYRELRDERALLDVFAIEILHLFVNGLASMRGRRDDESDEAAEAINKTLRHVRRILTERADLFRKIDAKRRVPPDVEPGNLVGVSKWLLVQTASPSKYCGDASVDLFVRLAPLCGVTLSEFAQTHVPHLVSLYDGHVTEEAFPRLVDGYAFVLSHNLTSVDVDALVERAARFVDLSENKPACCAAILKLIDALVNHVPDNALWRPQLWTLVRRALFEPHALGLDDTQYVRVVIDSLVRRLPRHHLEELAAALRADVDLRVDLGANANYEQRQLLKGLLILKPHAAFGPPLRLVDSLMTNFYSHLEDGVVFLPDLSETAIELCSLALDYTLSEPEELRTLVEHLAKPYVVKAPDADATAFGGYLATRFGDAILKHLSEDVEIIFRVGAGADVLVELASRVLIYIERGGAGAARAQRALLDYWPAFRDYFDQGRAEAGFEYVKKLAGAFGRSDEVRRRVSDWLEGKLNTGHFLGVALVLVDLCEGAEPVDYLTRAPVPPEGAELLLAALPSVRSVPIFEFIVRLYGASEIDAIPADLLRCCLNNNREYEAQLLNATLKACLDPSDTFRQRVKLCDGVLGVVLNHSSRVAFESFVADNVDRLVDDLEGGTSEAGRRIAYFRVAEVLFSRIPMADEKIRLRLVTQCLAAFKSPRNGSKEERRKTICAAYKALASIVSNSIKLSSFYEKLFVREEDGVDILWRSLVDVDVEYDFATDFASLPKQRMELVHIRDGLRRDGERRLVYLESQKLFNSSLSQDVTKYDFNTAVLRGGVATDDVDNGRSEIVLDGTEVNRHECMATVCGLIRHVFETGVYRLPDEGETPTLPNWMEGVRCLLLDKNTPRNVKIFWAKVIDNVADVFRHFAAHFVEPLMRFVIDNVAGTGMNYFVSDVMVTVATWSSHLGPYDDKRAELCSRMLAFAVGHLNNERRDVFKYHVELIKLVVENWKDRLRGRCPSLSARLGCATCDRKAEIGIHLASVFLANGLCPDAAELWAQLTRLLNSDLSSVYKPCAETLGLLLDYVRKELPQLEESYRDQLSRILLKPDLDINKYAYCVEAVVIHYPEVVDRYHAMKIFNHLGQSNDNLKVILLKIVLRNVETLRDVPDFRAEKWCAHLECENVSVQMVALEIVARAFPTLATSDDEFRHILRALAGHSSNPNVLCRARAYDVATLVLNHNPDSSVCRKLLVRGLGDPDEEIRAKIRKFWSESRLIPSGIREKFPALLSLFYYPDCEDRFLNDVVYFLLDSVATDGTLFEHPLEDCVYEPYHLETDWRLRPPSAVPLFAETFSDDHWHASSVGDLRATRTSFAFTPTTTLREQEITQRTGLESSLLIGGRGDDPFVDPNRVRLSGDYRLPKRRFLKDKAKIAAHYAHVEVTKKIDRAAKRREGVVEAEKKVTIYRKYRKGDFPDILITLDSLIGPLKMLTLHDTKLSKELFSVLFRGLSVHIADDRDSYADAIKRIFTESVQFNAHLFSVLFDVLLEQKRLVRFDSDLVSNISRQSGLLSVGSFLLEEYIADGGDVEPGPSKRSFRQDDPETQHWIRLAELYREIGEWPSVQTIFTEKTLCGDTVKMAIAMESRGMYRSAQDLYERLLREDDSPERKDFYYESLFKCMARLGSWDKIVGAVQSMADPVWPALWDGDWHQQKIMPWLVEAQVKNIQFGEGVGSGPFVADINASLSTPDQAAYLTQNFSKELSLLWLIHGDVVQASQYCRTAVAHFLNEWQLVNPAYADVRYEKLVQLKSIVEIRRFVELASTWEQDTPEKLRRFLDLCKRDGRESAPCEETLLNRRLFIRLLERKMEALREWDTVRELKTTKILLDMEFMEAAAADGNYFMTRKYFRNYVGVAHRRLSAILTRLTYLYAENVRDPSLKLDKLLEALERIGQMTDGNCKEKLQSALDFFDVSGTVTEVLNDRPDLFEPNRKRISEIFDTVDEPPTKIAAEKLKSLVLGAEVDRDESDPAIIRKALVKLAYFAKDDDRRSADFVIFVSRAMRFGSDEARQLFPCILLKNGLDSELRASFEDETREIPTWMYLAWIPQLLAAGTSTVDAILERIAETYPQAMMYAYRLSQKRTEPLARLLSSEPLVDRFVAALSKVKVPLVSLGDYLKKMYRCSDPDEIMSAKRALEEDMFDACDGLRGHAYDSVKRFKALIERIASASEPEVRRSLLAEVDAKRQELLTQRGGTFSAALKDYCPWLAAFSASQSDFELEVPGQYSGEKPPLVKHHARISMFRPNVAVMRSMRRPIKVTMVGMDGKEYPFLVKFGEDVRQDQRIEQLLRQMNAICANGGRKTHQVVTYQVVPLSKRLGIIQWVENCRPLASFMLKQGKFGSVATKYEKFFVKAENDIESHGRTAMTKGRDKVVPFFAGLVGEIPSDVLKKALWGISFTTENFIAYRDNFVESYAATSVAQWLLGIGDRHLENFMVCTDTGKVVGIDFGHAFGTATQLLPIPELVPIRLTPHILALTEPLRERGPLRHVMIECLKSLRQNRAALLATMEVFVQEPSEEWLENAPDYKTKKVDQVRRKLGGASSVDILIEDLEANRSNRFNEAYAGLVREVAPGGSPMGVEEQVDALIRHATDYNLLGRMWRGWTPWI